MLGGYLVAYFEPCGDGCHRVEPANELVVDKHAYPRRIALLPRYVGYLAHGMIIHPRAA